MHPIYQSYRQIQQFTADAAHELGTPLAAIRATIEFAFLAVATKVKLVPEIKASQPVEVMGNMEQLYRLVSNLVVNAIGYTPPEGHFSYQLSVISYQ